MKKIASLLLFTIVYLACFSMSWSSADAIRVTVDGAAVRFPDAEPFVDANGRTLVPLRPIAEAMGLDVKWEEVTQIARFVSPVAIISFQIGRNSVRVNGWHESMDTEPVIVGGRTFAPVRYLAEAAGYDVGWDGANKTVSLEKNYSLREPLSEKDILKIMDRYLDLFEHQDFNVFYDDDLNIMDELLSYAIHMTPPASYETRIGGEFGVFETEVEKVRLSDAMETAGLLYTKNIAANLRPSDVFYYEYHERSADFTSWGYYDPPDFIRPVVLGCSSSNGICEIIVSTSLEGGYMGLFFAGVGDDDYAKALTREVIYYDIISEDDFFNTKIIRGYFDSPDGIAPGEPYYYTDYGVYMSAYEPALQRAVDYMRKNPDMFSQYKVTLVIEGESVKLSGIEKMK